MIRNREKFVAGMALLAGAFGREVDAPVQAAYLRVLSPLMSDGEFERAVSLATQHETFWPSPAVLLSKVKVNDESAAALAFEHVNRVLGANGGFRFLTAETYQREFDAPTKAAVASVGGLAAIGNTTDERWSGLERKFIKAYVASLHPQLAPPPADPKVKQLAARTANTMALSNRDRAAGERP